MDEEDGMLKTGKTKYSRNIKLITWDSTSKEN